MLILDSDWAYLVWPSWATEFSITWGEMAKLIEGPISDEFIDGDNRRLIETGRVKNVAIPIELFSGAFGFGFFRRKATPGRYWLGYEVFRDEAAFMSVPAMQVARNPETGEFWSNVAFIELRGDIGLQRAGTGWKKPREFPCPATFEHVDAAGDSVYWLLDCSPSKKPLPGIETLAAGAREFGLDLEPISEIAADIAHEVSAWFTNDRRMQWFKVTGGPRESGWHLAAMFYCLLHLKRFAGRRLTCAHLVAQIENQPHIRLHWDRR